MRPPYGALLGDIDCPDVPIVILLSQGGKNDFPCRVNTIPRQIPSGPWYTAPAIVIPLTGILPFGSIFIEM
jgi:hypothetical protein